MDSRAQFKRMGLAEVLSVRTMKADCVKDGSGAVVGILEGAETESKRTQSACSSYERDQKMLQVQVRGQRVLQISYAFIKPSHVSSGNRKWHNLQETEIFSITTSTR